MEPSERANVVSGIVGVLTGLYACLSLLAVLGVAASFVYTTFDAFAPTNNYLSMDLRGLTLFFALLILAPVAALGLVIAGSGLALSLLGRGRRLQLWWVGLLVLFGAELLSAAVLFLLHPSLEDLRGDLLTVPL